MTLLQTLFRPQRSEADSPRVRRTWPRVRRSQSAAVVLDACLRHVPSDAPPQGDETGAAAAIRGSTPTLVDGDQQPWSHEDPGFTEITTLAEATNLGADVKSGRKSHLSLEPTKSPHGSSRFKDLVNRLRSTKSHDDRSLSAAFPPTELRDIEEVANTDPVKRGPRSQGYSAGELEAQAQGESRQVSAQTVQSHESAHTTTTVRRHPSQRMLLGMQEVGEDWSVEAFATVYKGENTHRPDISDPFSDGKVASSSHRANTSSRYSDDPIHGMSEASQGSERHGQPENPSHRASATSHSESQGSPSHSQRENPSTSSHQTFANSESQGSPSHTQTGSPSHQTSTDLHSELSRLGSERYRQSHPIFMRRRISSRNSRRTRFVSQLNPASAREAFEMSASYLGLQITLPQVVEEQPAHDVENSPRRRRFLGRVRPVRSNVTLGNDSPATPARFPILRRTQTFANLLRRHRRAEPMTSLRGFSVERIGRLGGTSYLLLPSNLIPCPLELPACIIATIMYLRKFGPGINAANLFTEPGDLQSAIRLYDHFASHVLDAAKDEARILSHVRVASMPTWGNNKTIPVLSVGWTFKALLAGLPGGILGSAELFTTLQAIFHLEGIDEFEDSRQFRAQFITFAIVGLTSEMQCALICAVFGFLSGLLHADVIKAVVAGSPLREAATDSKADLAGVFGPLLTGTRTATGSGTGASKPRRDGKDVQAKESSEMEREREEVRVAWMLIELWPEIHDELRAWAEVYASGPEFRQWMIDSHS